MKTTTWRSMILGGLLVLLMPGLSLAFDNEPEGWEKASWNTSAESFIKSRKDQRGKANAKQVRKILKTRDVVLESDTDFLERSWDVRWTFGADGLHTVVLAWEDSSPSAYKAHREVFAQLEKAWGTPTQSTDNGERVWEGWQTRATVRRIRLASGSGVEITLKKFNGKKKNRGPSRSKSILDNDIPGLPAGP